MTEMGAGERFEPVPDLRFKFHRTPGHTTDAITSLHGTGHPHAVELQTSTGNGNVGQVSEATKTGGVPRPSVASLKARSPRALRSMWQSPPPPPSNRV